MKGCFFIFMTSWLAMALPVRAASFDCGKAKTGVEKMICADAKLSLQDEELATLFGKVFKKFSDETMLKRQQREWLRVRNSCGDVPCLHRHYQGRIAELKELNVFKNEESYTLLMSKDDDLCNHMMGLFNQDLKKHGWRGDEYQENHEEFKRVPWKPARFSSVINGWVEYTDVEGASFDFNNDGVQDFVVRWQSSLFNARADLLFMLDRETAKHASDLDSGELNADNQIYIAGGGYDVSLPVKVMAGLRVLQPFIYHGTSYLFMRQLFEFPPIRSGYAVIVKYGGGKFVSREMTGKMEDICYYQRNHTKHIH
jgi:uncharacterized protein